MAALLMNRLSASGLNPVHLARLADNLPQSRR